MTNLVSYLDNMERLLYDIRKSTDPDFQLEILKDIVEFTSGEIDYLEGEE